MNEGSNLDDLKRKLKEELKKELLEEIYNDLKSEEKNALIIQSNKNVENEELPQNEFKIPNSTDSDNLILLTIKAFLKIASHSLKYANSSIPRHKWLEIIGLLAGTMKKGQIIVEDAYPMGHGNAIHVDIKDYKNYAKAYRDLRNNKFFICGWYHSHPSYGLFMSDEDVATQSRYQRLWKDSIALVIDPELIKGNSFGFEIYRLNMKNRKWYNIPFKILGAPDIKMVPDLLEFIRPIIDGKALFLEYDEN